MRMQLDLRGLYGQTDGLEETIWACRKSCIKYTNTYNHVGATEHKYNLVGLIWEYRRSCKNYMGMQMV